MHLRACFDQPCARPPTQPPLKSWQPLIGYLLVVGFSLCCMLLTLVGQRMAIRLMRLDGDDSRAQYIQVYLSVQEAEKGAESEDD